MYRTSDASSGKKSASANTKRMCEYYTTMGQPQSRVCAPRSAAQRSWRRTCSARLATSGSTDLHFSHHAAPKSTSTCAAQARSGTRPRLHTRVKGRREAVVPCRCPPARASPAAPHRCSRPAGWAASPAQAAAAQPRRRRRPEAGPGQRSSPPALTTCPGSGQCGRLSTSQHGDTVSVTGDTRSAGDDTWHPSRASGSLLWGHRAALDSWRRRRRSGKPG